MSTLVGFRALFPEFERLDDAHVEAHLSFAERRTVEAVWGNALREEAVYYTAADTLARSPWGYNARLSQPGQPTAYEEHLNYLRLSLPKRGMVLAQPGVNLSPWSWWRRW